MRKKKPTLKSLKRKAWNACSVYVRKGASDRHGGVNCYTCHVYIPWREAQAGHAIPGRTGMVLFDTDIIRPQCVSCNVFHRGRYHIFTARLIRENGLAWWERKEQESHGTKKYTREDYERIIDRFSV